MSEEHFSPCLSTPIVKFRSSPAYVSLNSETPVCLSAICSFSILLFSFWEGVSFPPAKVPVQKDNASSEICLSLSSFLSLSATAGFNSR